MISHSPAIAVTLAVDMTALMLYNVAGMAVTGHLGAVFRTVLETGRTLFVWIVDLMLFYGNVAGEAKLGESWSSWSWNPFTQACKRLSKPPKRPSRPP